MPKFFIGSQSFKFRWKIISLQQGYLRIKNREKRKPCLKRQGQTTNPLFSKKEQEKVDAKIKALRFAKKISF
jgi:hypothetical protein